MTTIISPDLFHFFADLAANQNRDWFHANRQRYVTSVQQPLRDLVVTINTALVHQQVGLSGDPKRSVSRINRDVRFSPDKSPYKTYAAVTFTRVPGEMGPGLLYLQLAPGDCFAGVGFYATDPVDLTRIRRAMAENPPAWDAVLASLAGAGRVLEEGDPLKRMPKGFEALAGATLANDLKRRSLVSKLRLRPEDVADDQLPERVACFAKDCQPLLEFGWRALR